MKKLIAVAFVAGSMGGCGADGTTGQSFTASDAVAAMGPENPSNPLNHARYTDAEALVAAGPHTVDTTLTEADVDTFVANNGYLTAESDPNVGVREESEGDVEPKVPSPRPSAGGIGHGLAGSGLLPSTQSDLQAHS